MDETAEKRDRIKWKLPFYSAVGALFLFIPVMIYGDDSDVLYFLIAFLIAVILLVVYLLVALVQIFRNKKLPSLAVFSMLLVYWVVSLILLKNSFVLHSTAQWLFHSEEYKAKVLAQPAPANGELRHIEWDGWGWGGNDTVVYLVYDPDDSLSAAAKSHSPGKFSGIPCEVYRVRRLESHYYTVLFYTDTGWGYDN
jgi:hypothetical protein